jgi:hypothetical protein
MDPSGSDVNDRLHDRRTPLTFGARRSHRRREIGNVAGMQLDQVPRALQARLGADLPPPFL